MTRRLPRPVTIHYLRPPDREQVFRQTLVHEGDVLVSWLPEAGVARPTVVDGRRVLEQASPVVWLTFPGLWHDIGRFHASDGTFTGYYANILTPVRTDREPEDHWHTTDLFLDVFVTPEGEAHLLDRHELDEAIREGWLEPGQAQRAEAEAERLIERCRAGYWPPAVAREWTLERVLSLLP